MCSYIRDLISKLSSSHDFLRCPETNVVSKMRKTKRKLPHQSASLKYSAGQPAGGNPPAVVWMMPAIEQAKLNFASKTTCRIRKDPGCSAGKI